MNGTREFHEQAMPPWRRAVLKVGSSLLAGRRGELSTQHVLSLAQFMAASLDEGREVVLVSSGAVAAGRIVLAQHGGAHANRVHRQAMAALGQTQTIALWQRLFDRPLAQVLLTHDDVRDRRRYLTARATIQELLRHDVLPVVNENDTVAVDGLTLGDNDNLAAIVAGLVDADVLLIATDIDGLYSADPRENPAATAVDEVAGMTPEVMAMAAGPGSRHGTGGMRSKLQAAQKAAAAGIDTILFNGRRADVVRLLAQGRFRGTRLRSAHSRLQARKYWLRHMPATPGSIRVDAGAARALCERGASLLPKGITAVSGEFQRGDMVEIIDADAAVAVARGIAQYGAAEIRRIRGCHSDEIAQSLGYSYGEEVVHRDDLVTVSTTTGPTDEGVRTHG